MNKKVKKHGITNLPLYEISVKKLIKPEHMILLQAYKWQSVLNFHVML